MNVSDDSTGTKVLVSLTDPRFGGPQRSSLEVAELLKHKGIETDFLIPSGAGEFESIAKGRGFSVHRPNLNRLLPPAHILSNVKYLANFPSNVWKIIRIIRKNDIDIVNARMTVNFQAVVAAIISSTPLVWHFNDVNAPRPLAHICSILAQQYADEIVVSAENVVDNYFSEVGDKTKIYPTVSPDNFNEQEIPYFDERVNGNDDSTILGLVGNINPVKGYETFINAFEEVVNEHNDVVAMIAGRRLTTQKSYYQSLLRQIEEKGLEDKIHFLGWTENIEAFLSSIDLFVMPSHSETGPMTLMEAMVMKKPIVTTNVGVVPEQLINGEHAWIVESRSADQLATALNDALAMRGKWEDLGRSAKERAIDKFSLEAAVGRYYSVYDSINQ